MPINFIMLRSLYY